MKKILLSIALLAGLNVNGQQILADGSFANDFALKDIYGYNHNLYDYLSQGKTVFIDQSATWCGPCWGLHLSNGLRQLWQDHGPAGAPGVSANTTNDVMVIWIEGDMSTTNAELYGGGSSQGDWVTGVPYPIVDLQAARLEDNMFSSNYPTSQFPTMYRICPNLKVYEAPLSNNGQNYNTGADYYSMVGTCEAPTNVTDVKALFAKGNAEGCASSDYTPKLMIQNYGTGTLTDATVNVSLGGNVVSTGTFSGALGTFATTTIACSTIPNFTGGVLSYNVTTTNDAVSSNGTKTLSVPVSSVQATGINVTVEITTDAYGSETSWAIIDDLGARVTGGGPFNNLSASGTTVQTPSVVTLNENRCYIFEMYDSYGDGMTSAGAGSYTVKDAANNVLATGGNFTKSDATAFKTGLNLATISELEASNFQVYPNPASNVVNVSFDAPSNNEDFEVTLTDIQGRILITKNLNAISGFQKVELSVSDITAGNYMVKVKSNSTSSVRSIMID